MKSLGQLFRPAGCSFLSVKLVSRVVAFAILVGDVSAFAQAPQITTPPQNQAVGAGSLVVLSATVTGGQPLYYQWLWNSNALPSETNGSLIFSSIASSNTGAYTLRVTNSLGSAEATAQLTVVSSPALKRTTLALAVGARGAFEALLGTNVFTYQWRFNNNDLPGETNRVLGFPSAATNQAGDYVLRAFSVSNTVELNAHLDVVSGLNSNLAAYYPLDGNALDLGPSQANGTRTGTQVASDRFATPVRALSFNGVSDEITVPDGPVWRLGGGDWTMALWVRLDGLPENKLLLDNYTGSAATSEFSLAVIAGVTPGVNMAVTAAYANFAPFPEIADGHWHQVVARRSGEQLQVLIDGFARSPASLVQGVLNDSTEPVHFGSRYLHDNWFWGAMDEVRLWKRGLSDAEVMALYFSESPEWLAITQQPIGSTNVAGTNLLLSAAATGVGSLSYQWRFNGVNLLGATNTTFTITNVRPVHSGAYTVMVSNSVGSITSQVATLTAYWPTNLISTTAGALTSSGGNTVAAGSADYNGDGWNDVFLSNTGADPSYLLRNLTNGTFGSTSGDPNVPAAGNLNSPYTPVFADYDNDGRLDLYLTFLQGPDALATTNRLYRNLDGTNFLRITNAGLPVTLVANSDSAAWADLDADGWVDLVVAYRNRSQVGVYRNIGDGTFSDFTSTANLNISALSVSLGDYDDDGRLDVACLSADYPNSIFKLFRNLGSFTFTNLTNTTITPAPESFSVRWQDYNNDGKIDLRLYGFDQLAQIWTNSGTGAFSLSFQSTNCGIATADFNLDGRIDEVPLAGTVAADLNHDGLPDILKATGANEQLWTNQWNGAGWLVVKLVGQQSNRTGIGAKIRATATIDGVDVTQTRQISGGEGYGCQIPLEANFGFGDATNISLLRIEWPSGKVQEFTNVSPNQFLTIQEQTIFYFGVNGSGTVSYSPVKSNYFVGENVTLTATTNRYYRFVQWSDGNTNAVRNYTVGLSNVLTAIFTNAVPLEAVVLKQWEASFGGTNSDSAQVVRATSDGGFLIGCSSASGVNGNKFATNWGGTDIWLIKVNSAGQKQWEQTFGGTSNDSVQDILQTSDGGCLVLANSLSGPNGSKTTANFGDYDAWLLKVDSSGGKVWEKSYGGSAQDIVSSIAPTSDGGFVMCGSSLSAPGSGGGNRTAPFVGTLGQQPDLWVIRIDSLGNMLWDKSFGPPGGSSGDNITVGTDGKLWIAGHVAGAAGYLGGIGGVRTSPSPGGIGDIWLLNLDANGVFQWERSFGGPGYDDGAFHNGCLLADGSFALVARYNIGTNESGYIVRVSPDGITRYEQTYGGSGKDEFKTLDTAKDGGVLVGGESDTPLGNGTKTSPKYGGADYWITKLDAQLNKKWEYSYGGSGSNETILHLLSAADGGFVVAGSSDSPPGSGGGNKTSASYGSGDVWVVKLSDTEQPIGTPLVLVNGLYAISNTFVIPATNVPVQASLQTSFTNGYLFYTLDGTVPSSNSLAYTTNFSLVYSTTVRAIAYNSNYTASAEADPVVVSIAPYVFFTGSVGSGTVTRSPDTNSYSLGQQVTLTATPSRYYTFVQWSDGVTSTNRTITVGSGSVFTAIFTNTVPLETAILQQWQQSFGGTNEDYIVSVVATGDGGYLLGGESKSGSSGNKTSGNFGGFDLWLVKVDANGSKQWETNYGGTGEDRFRCLALTSDGGYIMGGQSDSGVSGNKTTGNFGSSDAWLLKLAADGSKQWETNYGGNSGEDLRGFAQTSDGGYILGCASLSGASGNKTTGNFGLWDQWILKVDSSGVKQWEANYGGNNDDYLNAIAVTADGNIILGGHSWSSPSGNKTSGTFGETDFWFVKLNAAGAKLWETNYGGLLTDALTTMTLTPDGGLIAGGYTTSGASGNKTSGNHGGLDSWLVKLNEHGFKQWETNYGGTLNDGLYSIASSGDGGYVVGGFSASGANGNKASTNFGGQDFWTLKLDALGPRSAEVTYGGNANDSINSLVRTSDGGYLLGGYSPSGVNGNKTSPNFGLDDFWLIKTFVREVPIGMPAVLVNGFYSPTNHILTNGLYSVSIQSTFTNAHIFYTVDGTAPSSNSLAYTTNFSLIYSTTIRAIAYNSNYTAAAEADPVTVSIAPYVFFTGSVGSGTVTRSPDTNSYSLGQQVTLTATPNRYYTFVQWSDGVTATNRTITVGSSSVFAAIFTNTVLLEELVFKQWDRSYGGSSNDELTAIQAVSDGGYLLGGYSSSGISGNKTNAGFGNTDYWIVKVDATGSKQWERVFGGGAEDSLFAVQRTGDGGYYLGGISSSGVSGNKTNSGYGNQDFWVVKTDSNGNKLWDYSYGGTGNDRLQDMAVTPDGGFIAIGSSTSGASGNKTSGSFGLADIWCVRANANGEIVWQQSFGGNADDVGYRVKLTDDGGFAIAGSSASAANSGGGNKTTPNYGLRDFWFLRLDANGVKIAEQTIGGFNEDRANALVQTGDGGFALAGWSRSDIEGNKTTLHCNSDDGWLVRLGSTGGILSDVDIGGSGQDEFATGLALTDGSLMLAGSSDSAVSCNKSNSPLGGLDYWLIRTDHNGGKKWESVFGGTGTDSLQAVSETPDGGLLLGGLSDSVANGNKSATNSGLTDFWIVRLNTREAPIGMPAVLVNGNFSPTNYFPFPATNGVQVTFQTTYPNGSIFYTVDGSQPDPGSAFYDGSPIGLSNSAVIRAVAFDESFVESQECDPVTITFIPIYTLTATTPGGGSISFSPTNGPYLSNSVVTFTATPSNGWVFMNWTGAATSTNPLLNLTLDSNKSLQAVFGTFVSNTIAPAGFGAVTREPAQGPYPYGSSVRMSAVPATGKYFIRWTGAANGLSNSPIDFVVTVPNTNASTLFATLSANVFALTTLVDGNGTVTKSPQLQNYTNGQSVMLTATNGPGYTFVGWSGDASGAANPINVTMNTNKIVTANFSTTAPPSNSPPSISITNPVDGMVFVAPTNLTISGMASDTDGMVTQIQLRYSTNLLATITNAAFGFNWTNPPVGTNILTAVATDNGGLATTSSPVSIVVQTALPLIFLTGPSNNAAFTAPANITLEAAALDNDSTISNVTLYAGTNLLATLTTPPPTYSFTWSNVAVGSYTLSARVQDVYGPIVTSAPVNITVSAPNIPAQFHLLTAAVSAAENAGTISVVITNDGTLGGSVNYACLDVSATGGNGSSGDYTKIQGLLTFTNGEVAKTLAIPIRDDLLPEANESFVFNLSTPGGGATLSSPVSVTVTLLDDDAAYATNSWLAIAFPSAVPDTSGKLRVTLMPPEANGQWRFPWEMGWRTSGSLVTNLEVGNYEVEFRPVAGYAAIPSSTIVAVAGGGGITESTNQYFVTGAGGVGYLTVNLLPNTVTNGGWRFVGESVYRVSGSSATNLVPGVHVIEFQPVSGWAAPSKRAVQIYADQGSVVSGNYLVAEPLPGGAQLPVAINPFSTVNDSLNFTPQLGYAFNGQLQTANGFGSGAVVREKVVLTAAHVVFDDNTLSFVNEMNWFFQKHAGEFEPRPLKARGWYVLSSYAAARSNDLASAYYAPGQSSPQSRNFDVAALYFTGAAGRGGYGGYLTSDQTTNEWFISTRQKLLTGYPLDGAAFGYAGLTPGKMHKVDALNYTFTAQTNRVYSTPGFLSFPGNSGGPVYVQFSNALANAYYPAGVYLGTLGNNASLVRSIDSNVVAMINLAANLGDEGTNNTGGGVVTIIPSAGSGTGVGYLQVTVGPPAAIAAGAGWRLSGDVNYSSSPNFTRVITNGGGFSLEFAPAAGWNLPPSRTITVPLGQLTMIDSRYSVIPPSLAVSPAGFGIIGTTNTMYRLEYRTNLSMGAWLPLQTNTLSQSGFNLIFPLPTTNTLPAAFYRAVWLP